jgi:hypothetical protein
MRSKLGGAFTLFFLMAPLSTLAQYYNLVIYDNGGGLAQIVTADLNNDGKPDVAGLTYNSKTGVTSVTTLLGNGTGGFLTAKNTPLTGINNPSNLAVADVNGDGTPDAVFTGNDPITGVTVVGIMQGNGDGTFQSAQEIKLTSAATRGPVVIGDFNGDGTADIAVGSQNVISVLLGQGSGKFSAPVVTNEPFRFDQCMVAGDFNNDGRLDLTSG